MSEFLTVVAALADDSSALDVLRLAGALTDTKRGDRLFGVHAIPTLSPALDALLFPYTCFGDDEEALKLTLAGDVARRLHKRVGQAIPNAGTGGLRITHGGAPELLETSATLGPDILVVGTPDHGGGSAYSVGGFASKLVRSNPTATAFARPRELGKLEVRRIAVAIDLSDNAADLLSYTLWLAQRLGATVTPITVVPTAAAIDHAGLVSHDNAAGRARKEIAARWAQLESKLDLPFPIASTLRDRLQRPIQRDGDPGAELVAAAAEAEADLLVAGRCVSGASGQRLGRVAEYVARHARSAVLLVPPAPHETLSST